MPLLLIENFKKPNVSNKCIGSIIFSKSFSKEVQFTCEMPSKDDQHRIIFWQITKTLGGRRLSIGREVVEKESYNGTFGKVDFVSFN